MRQWLKVFGWLAVAFGATANAADYLRDRAEVEALLTGATLKGTYLRTGSPYTLEFRADGALIKGSGGNGRWWVNSQGQYCREWLSGRLQGNQACLDLALEGDTLAIYSRDKRVAEGRLVRE